MKQEVSKPVLFGVIGVLVVLAAFFLWRASSGPSASVDVDKMPNMSRMMTPEKLEAMKKAGGPPTGSAYGK